jgi:hypothetical protein
VAAASADATGDAVAAKVHLPPGANEASSTKLAESAQPSSGKSAAPTDDDEPADKVAEPESPAPSEPAPKHASTSAGHDHAAHGSVSINVRSEPSGAQVSGHGHSYGATPLSIKLAPGAAADLSFTKAGYQPASKHYRVTRSQAQVVHVTLKKVVEPRKAATPPAPAPTPQAHQRKGWFAR